MTKEQIKEVINKTDLDITQIMELIEQYILDRKGRSVKLAYPKNVISIGQIIEAYNDNVVPYYVNELKLNA